MNRPLTDTELALASAKHMARSMDLLMDAMGVPPSSLLRPKAAPRAVPDSALRWSEMDLEDCGWVLHLGYSWSGDPFDDGDITLVKIVLNTGQRDIDLGGADLDRDTFFAAEEICREDWRNSYQVRP